MKAKKIKAKINKAGGKTNYFICDIKDPNQIKKTVKEIKEKFKKIDILINNTGVWTDESLEKNKPELIPEFQKADTQEYRDKLEKTIKEALKGKGFKIGLGKFI